MRRFIVIMLCLSFSSVAYTESKHNADEMTEFCKRVSVLASSIMGLRQYGEPIADTLDSLLKPERPDMHTMVRALVEDAYTEPLWPFEAQKETAKTEFGNEKYLWCLKLLRETSN